MGKGHYPGGSSLIGDGRIIKSKGRSGGIGDASAAAVRELQKRKERREKQKLAEQVKENQRKMHKLSRQWAKEKAAKAIEVAREAERVRTSPLAAALRDALGSPSISGISVEDAHE